MASSEQNTNEGMAIHEDDFFKNDTPHGLVKRFMWKQHIQAFIAKTQQTEYETIVFDGFAGAGRYGEDDKWPLEIERYGSPLISIRVAIDFHILKKKLELKFDPSLPITGVKEITEEEIKYLFGTCTIKLYLVEKKRDNFEKLVQNATSMFLKYGIPVAAFWSRNDQMTLVSMLDDIPVCCEIFNASFQDVDPPAYNRNCCMVSIIDPYGYTQIPMNTVELFVGYNREVYINLMSQFVNRFKKESKEGLENLFGLDHRVVLSRLKTYTDGNIQNVANLYADVLKETTVAAASADLFSLSFEMRNKGNVPLFHLIFATSHEKGFEAMKEAMNNGTQSDSKLSLSDYNIVKKGQILNLKNGQNNAQVAGTIFEEFKGKSDVDIKTVRHFILHDTIHVWRKKCLQILEKDGRITRVMSDRRRRYTYPDRFPCSFDFRGDA